jgi:hypothetical protein
VVHLQIPLEHTQALPASGALQSAELAQPGKQAPGSLVFGEKGLQAKIPGWGQEVPTWHSGRQTPLGLPALAVHRVLPQSVWAVCTVQLLVQNPKPPPSG